MSARLMDLFVFFILTISEKFEAAKVTIIWKALKWDSELLKVTKSYDKFSLVSA